MKRTVLLLSLFGLIQILSPHHIARGHEAGTDAAASASDRIEAPAADPWDPKITRDLRNPFLPPGYRPAEREADVEDATGRPARPAQWEQARATLSIRGISQIGGRVAALIGDRVVSAGDTVETIHDGLRYRWRVAELDTGTGIQLERLSATDPNEPIPEDEGY